jgi:hypothetical protein
MWQKIKPSSINVCRGEATHGPFAREYRIFLTRRNLCATLAAFFGGHDAGIGVPSGDSFRISRNRRHAIQDRPGKTLKADIRLSPRNKEMSNCSQIRAKVAKVKSVLFTLPLFSAHACTQFCY